MSAKTYMIKEIFYTLQGEGVRKGCASTFVRFAGCNLNCKKEEVGFDCDTDWFGGEKMTGQQILDKVSSIDNGCRWIVFTGGEPTLQLDDQLVTLFKQHGYSLAIESNGTHECPKGLDWICVCPKRPDDQIMQREVNELKLVLKDGMEIPTYTIGAEHHILSPAFETPDRMDVTTNHLPDPNLRWVIQKCLENPKWRVSVQDHKAWGVR